MSNYKIIDDIEMPEPGRERNGKYPWRLLEIGQGFEVPATGEKYGNGQDKAQSNLEGCWRAWAKRNGSSARFQLAKVGDVIRVKRIA